MKYGWLKGKVINLEDQGMDFTKAGFRYGINVFDALRVTTKKENDDNFRYTIFNPSKHIRRLMKGAEWIGLDINYTEKEILESIKKIIVKNSPKEDFGIRIFCYSNEQRISNSRDRCCLLIYLINLDLLVNAILSHLP